MKKYPKKNRRLVKIPYKHTDNKWYYGFLNPDGSVDRTCFSDYDKERHAWIPAMAFNNRYGYTRKQVNKIIDNFYDAKKQKLKKQKEVKKGKKK